MKDINHIPFRCTQTQFDKLYGIDVIQGKGA